METRGLAVSAMMPTASVAKMRKARGDLSMVIPTLWFTAEDCFLEKAGTQNLAVRLDREQRQEQADTAKNKDCLWRFTVNVCSGYSRNSSNNCSHA